MDIRYNLLLNSDIDDLKSFCLTDQLSKNIMFDKYFWYTYFKLHELPLPPHDYTKAKDWIKSFKVMSKINTLFKKLEPRRREDSYISVRARNSNNFTITTYMLNHFTNKIQRKEIYDLEADGIVDFVIYNFGQHYEITYSVIHKHFTYIYIVYNLNDDELFQLFYDMMFLYNVNFN
jgi:hypothetical protein